MLQQKLTILSQLRKEMDILERVNSAAAESISQEEERRRFQAMLRKKREYILRLKDLTKECQDIPWSGIEPPTPLVGFAGLATSKIECIARYDEVSLEEVGLLWRTFKLGDTMKLLGTFEGVEYFFRTHCLLPERVFWGRKEKRPSQKDEAPVRVQRRRKLNLSEEDPHSNEEKQSHRLRAKHLVDWVLDVAGGRDNISFELHTKRVIRTSLVEPREMKISKAQRKFLK
ncbi:hypothetical protein K493DRAFT_345553 [Basidiobolus meristosporus CBS 931.73]|uniref:Uncharacterized protein n=1 Tax=Basidiobolus meristosporus CBS 931.73 TaxID=1314790 RepID=A0A1Y1Z3Q8_9FUNG|nr:hypothetical protein K493DRAFT_345553 [Basidiobolus meristosporus CBS 931.73]|eukprot:ORY04485.1 hypothetical protein K493DRAFT_345553 [Basidiobolus meristosporus CBS 931.73]